MTTNFINYEKNIFINLFIPLSRLGSINSKKYKKN